MDGKRGICGGVPLRGGGAAIGGGDDPMSAGGGDDRKCIGGGGMAAVSSLSSSCSAGSDAGIVASDESSISSGNLARSMFLLSIFLTGLGARVNWPMAGAVAGGQNPLVSCGNP